MNQHESLLNIMHALVMIGDHANAAIKAICTGNELATQAQSAPAVAIATPDVVAKLNGSDRVNGLHLPKQQTQSERMHAMAQQCHEEAHRHIQAVVDMAGRLKPQA